MIEKSGKCTSECIKECTKECIKETETAETTVDTNDTVHQFAVTSKDPLSITQCKKSSAPLPSFSGIGIKPNESEPYSASGWIPQ